MRIKKKRNRKRKTRTVATNFSSSYFVSFVFSYLWLKLRVVDPLNWKTFCRWLRKYNRAVYNPITSISFISSFEWKEGVKSVTFCNCNVNNGYQYEKSRVKLDEKEEEEKHRNKTACSRIRSLELYDSCSQDIWTQRQQQNYLLSAVRYLFFVNKWIRLRVIAFNCCV